MSSIYLRMTIAILSIILTANSSLADLFLGFSSDSGGTFTDTIRGEVGDSITLGLYIRQTGTETRLVDYGLLSFGTRATLDNSTVTVRDVDINRALFSDFSGSTKITPTDFSMVGEALFDADPKGASILLGFFIVDMNAMGTTNISFGDFNPLVNRSDFALNDDLFTDVDDLLFSNDRLVGSSDRSRSYSLTITAVPEPSSLILAPLAVFAFSRRRPMRVRPCVRCS